MALVVDIELHTVVDELVDMVGIVEVAGMVDMVGMVEVAGMVGMVDMVGMNYRLFGKYNSYYNYYFYLWWMDYHNKRCNMIDSYYYK